MTVFVIMEDGTTFEIKDVKVFSFSTSGIVANKLYTIDDTGYARNYENVRGIEVENF